MALGSSCRIDGEKWYDPRKRCNHCIFLRKTVCHGVRQGHGVLAGECGRAKRSSKSTAFRSMRVVLEYGLVFYSCCQCIYTHGMTESPNLPFPPGPTVPGIPITSPPVTGIKVRNRIP